MIVLYLLCSDFYNLDKDDFCVDLLVTANVVLRTTAFYIHPFLASHTAEDCIIIISP